MDQGKTIIIEIHPEKKKRKKKCGPGSLIKSSANKKTSEQATHK